MVVEERNGGEPRSAPRVLLGVTGSVAAVKAAELVAMMRNEGWEVRVVPTASAKRFLDSAEAEARGDGNASSAEASSSPTAPLHVDTDEEEWTQWQRKGDPVLHIELRRWADILVIAPLSANTLAKLAAGICDNLLTSVFRAWEFRSNKPVVLAPAMNTEMWEHPFTSRHLDLLHSLSSMVTTVQPVVKTLACGDTGAGALAPLASIIDATKQFVTH